MTPASRILLYSMFLFASNRTAASQMSFWSQTNFQNDGSVQAMIINSLGHVFVGVIGSVVRPIDGIYRSTDAGASWVQINSGLSDIVIHTFAINSLGYIFAGSHDVGVYRSINNGNSWVQLHAGMANLRIFSIVIDTSGRIFAAADGAIYWSDDNGDYWKACGLGDNNAFSLVINSSGILFAGSYGNGVVYSSTDRGDTWTQVNNGWWRPDPDYLGYQVKSLFVDRLDNLFAAISFYRIDGPQIKEFYRSTNNGASWVQIVHNGMTDRDITSYAVNSELTAFCAAFGGGVFRSTNNGLSWSDLNSGLADLKVRCLSIDPRGYLYVSTDGTGVFRSNQPTTGVYPDQSRPESFELKQNYPNPFNPSTTIRYALPNRSSVKIVITNTLGQQVALLENGEKEGGYHEVEWRANVASGVYFYRIDAASTTDANNRFVQVKKMLLLK